MALADTGRSTLVLDDAELTALLLVAADPQSPPLAAPAAQAGLGTLTDAGIVRSGVVAGWVLSLLAPLRAPRLSVLVEIHEAAEMVRLARAWLADDRATIARDLPDGRAQLRPLAPELLAAAVAVELGLAPAPAPAHRAAIAATEAELEDPPAGPLAELLAGRRGSWRVIVDADEVRSALAVLDGGAQGLWLVDLPEAPGREPGVTLRPTDADAVALTLRRLLAPRDGDRRASGDRA